MKEGNIKIPKMILFDYGQTLVNEKKFDGVRGTEAVLQYAIENKHHKTAKDIQKVADSINEELGRFDPKRRHLFQIEVPNYMFTSYLYESQGIKLSLSPNEIDKIFWDAAAPGTATEGITDFLAFLMQQNIRTGVISNISYSGMALEERINSIIPNNQFEFVIASSEYMFRKPNKKIFELALEKAKLSKEDVWYIGDQYECDIVGASNTGIFPIWYIGAIDLPSIENRDIMTIRNWDELKNIIENKELIDN